MPGQKVKPNRELANAVGAAFLKYAPELHRYVAKRMRNSANAPDLTQEIFELFVRRKERAEVIHNPLAYLFRIAFHVVGTALTDDRKNPVAFDSQLLADDLAAHPPSSSGDDAEELAVQEDVKAALAKLPKNHLTALLLVEGHGLSYKAAAKLSGFTPNTIASYVMHARAALKLALDGKEKDNLP